MPIDTVMPSSHLILCHPLLLLPPIPPSTRDFSNESALRMRWPKYWSFRFSISPFNEHPGLISFRMDWLDLLAVQGTLKSLLQHHSSKASIFRCSAFLRVQLSHPYTTTGKTIALTRQIFVGKVMPLLFNILSRLGITFLPMKIYMANFEKIRQIYFLEILIHKSIKNAGNVCLWEKNILFQWKLAWMTGEQKGYDFHKSYKTIWLLRIGGSNGRVSTCNAGDPGSIPGLGRSPGEGEYSCILAWRIPWTEKPVGLKSMGSQKVIQD